MDRRYSYSDRLLLVHRVNVSSQKDQSQKSANLSVDPLLANPFLIFSFTHRHNKEAERRRIKALRGRTPTPTPNGGKAGGGGARGAESRRSTIDATLLDVSQTSGCFNFCLGVIIVPYLFRYWLSFWYSLKCYLAQEAGEHQKQRYYYKLMIQQDSDVTFLRLFDTFIEVAPQKVLQIGIYLSGKEEMGSK